MIRWLSKRKAGFKDQALPWSHALWLVLFFCGIATSVLCNGRSAVQAQTSAQPSVPVQANPQQNAQKLATPYDAAAQSEAVLKHLNAVLRFYRNSEAPVQKIGEPSDLVYRDRAVTDAMQIAGFAFQSAKAEAVLMKQSSQSGQAATGAENEAQKLQKARGNAEQRITALKAQDAALEQQLATASPKRSAALQQQREQTDGELELQTAMADALGKIASIAGTSNNTGFDAQVNQLERSVPGLTDSKTTAVAPTLENLSGARSAGVSSQARVVFELLSTRGTIDSLIGEAGGLHKEAIALRTPLVNSLKYTIAEGQALSQSSAAALPASNGSTPSSKNLSASAETASSTQKSFNDLTATFNALSGVAVPLSQEILTLEKSQASLEAWRSAVNEEYDSVLESLFLRVLAIAIALGVIFGLSDVWRRATKRYVRDLRRRRQLLIVRRLLTGFLTGLVLIFGLVTQFSSLATFAGLITAGIAVGLQTILLSVAAYFFIIGRYGVKVGDRITIAGVTGDVVEVGLVRFYMMEMAGSGTDVYSTGRMAVFSNAVLFQAGTPLYKQMPGTEYAWHELTVKLSPAADYRPAVQEILKSLQSVYEEYRGQIEQQHKHLESWMDSSVDAPRIQSSLQMVDGGLQYWVRFPVIIRQATVIDEKMTEALLQLMSNDEKVKSAVNAPPVIRASVRA